MSPVCDEDDDTPHKKDVMVNNQTIESGQVVVPYDENLLERARTQWHFGDWQNLAQIDRDALQHQPDRAKLALLAAAGRLQTGKDAEAIEFIRLAQDWGVRKKLISQIMIAGVHNSIGRAAAIGNQQHRARDHFENAIAIGTPGCAADLLTQARMREQLRQLSLPTPEDCIKVRVSGTLSKNGSQFLTPKTLENSAKVFSSREYWENRYQKGGNSGYGSYGCLAEFKAKVINKFIEEVGIERMIEFGCGDGNQSTMLRVKNYVGVDISPTIVDKCINRFKNDNSKQFLTNDEYQLNPLKAELTLSLDVIFHLVEDEVFEAYMNTLFSASAKFCIIYSSNSDEMTDNAIHVRHRNFTKWISSKIYNWRLVQIIYNKYPHDGSVNPKDKSFSDFYFYERY